MTRRDLLLRYKQTVMGFGCGDLHAARQYHPVLGIFTRVSAARDGHPVSHYSRIADCSPGISRRRRFAFPASSLTLNAQLVTKVYFPREYPAIPPPSSSRWLISQSARRS
jgi:hypothetical protein